MYGYSRDLDLEILRMLRKILKTPSEDDFEFGSFSSHIFFIPLDNWLNWLMPVLGLTFADHTKLYRSSKCY